MKTFVSSLVLWVAICGLPLFFLFCFSFALLSFPIRRKERAQLFLDLMGRGLRNGVSPERTIASLARTGATSLGLRFYWFAERVEKGASLMEALERSSFFLPKKVRGLLKAGAELGDFTKVLPAAKSILDPRGSGQSATNYFILIAFALSPVVPCLLLTLNIFVFPKLKLLFEDMGVLQLPVITEFVFAHTGWIVSIGLSVSILAYLLTFVFVIASPFLEFRIVDAFCYRLPWIRKRIMRDFTQLLALLLDHGMTESRSVQLAATATGNLSFIERSGRIQRELTAGIALPQALQSLDRTGELKWRITNAGRGSISFFTALNGWIETLEAKAFQEEHAAAHLITTLMLLLVGTTVGLVGIGIFMGFIAILEEGLLW